MSGTSLNPTANGWANGPTSRTAKHSAESRYATSAVYDLHAHILPGVDDGAKTPEDTVEMAQVASDTGTKIILATPHRKDVTEES
ncbi:MAG: hypothetical protein QF368_14865, partial [SAR202 cluster bacterium]|nr:hypothetical protein [SAR202 cluster bacterium]